MTSPPPDQHLTGRDGWRVVAAHCDHDVLVVDELVLDTHMVPAEYLTQ